MRWLGLLTLLTAGVAGYLWAADVKEPADPPLKGFLVHEWGVFRVHDDVELANADLRQQWDELPPFVYGQTMRRDFPRHWDRVQVEVLKPVIFLHAPRLMTAELRVDFPSGTPAVWWPATENPAYHGNELEVPRKPERPVRSLQWKLHLQQPPWKSSPLVGPKPLSRGHWMQTLREVRCDDVYAPVGERNAGLEREKFVYYDGVLPAIHALSVKLEGGRATLTNRAKFTTFDVWVVDNRDPSKPRLARLPRLGAGESKDVELAPAVREAPRDDFADAALTAQLKDAGLNEDEAGALTTIWADDFFRGPGLALLYRLPQEEYDRMLPLTVKPRPEQVVRVGLVQQVPFDKDMADRVARLVKQLDDDAFNKREAAQCELEKLGRAAYGHLRRLRPTVFAPEPKRRVDELLEKVESQRTIKQ
jgi:hypothetical protein